MISFRYFQFVLKIWGLIYLPLPCFIDKSFYSCVNVINITCNNSLTVMFVTHPIFGNKGVYILITFLEKGYNF